MKKMQNKTRRKTIWKKYRPLCAAAGIIALIMNYFCKTNDADALLWILAPTTRWVSILSGISFTYLPHRGYGNHFYEFLIAPSCAGSRFMLLTFLMLVFSFPVSDLLLPDTGECLSQTASLRSESNMRKEYLWFGFSILFAYTATVFVNGIRISVSIYLPVILAKHGLMNGLLTPDRLHTVIGTVSYFTFLCVIYLLAAFVRRHIFARTDTTASPLPQPGKFSFFREYGKMLVPVFWYLLIVLLLPFAKRIYHNEWEGFGQYAASVLSVCMTVCMLFTGIRRITAKKTPLP